MTGRDRTGLEQMAKNISKQVRLNVEDASATWIWIDRRNEANVECH